MVGGWKVSDIAASAAVALVVVVVAVLVSGTSDVTTPDAEQYIRMAEGERAPAPYSNRLGAPTIASLLSDDGRTGLRIVTIGSMFLVVAGATLAARRTTGTPWPAIAVAAALCLAAPSPFTNFDNPYLTDAPALAGITLVAFAFVTNAWPVLFLVAIAGATAFRDAAAGTVLLWFGTRQFGRTVAALLTSVAIIGLFAVLADPVDEFVYEGPPSVRRWLRDLVLAWGPLWAVLPVGLLALHRSRSRWTVVAVVLGIEGLFLTQVFHDTGRMMLPLFVVMVVATAAFTHRLGRRHPVAGAVAAITVLLMPILNFQTTIVTLDRTYGMRFVTVCVGIAAVLFVTWCERDQLQFGTT